MAPKASIPYRLAEMTMFVRLRNPLNRSMGDTCFYVELKYGLQVSRHL